MNTALQKLLQNKDVKIIGPNPIYGKVDVPILEDIAKIARAKKVSSDFYNNNEHVDVLIMPNMYANIADVFKDNEKIKQTFNDISMLIKQNKDVEIVYVQNDVQTISSLPYGVFDDKVFSKLIENPIFISMLDFPEQNIDKFVFSYNYGIIEEDWLKYSIYSIDKMKFEPKNINKVFSYIGSTRGHIRDMQIEELSQLLNNKKLKHFIGGPIASSISSKEYLAKIEERIPVDKLGEFYNKSMTSIIPSEDGYGNFITKRFYEQLAATLVFVPTEWTKNKIIQRYLNKVSDNNFELVYDNNNELADKMKYLFNHQKVLEQLMKKRDEFYDEERETYRS